MVNGSMKPKQTIEVLKKIREKVETEIMSCEYDIKYSKENDYAYSETEKALARWKEKLQALDHAINCVGAIDQIKWERDIAIQQLHELGYQFGEKIKAEDKE